MKTSLVLFLGLGVVLAPAGVFAGARQSPDAEAAFQKIKGLAGEWQATTGDDGRPISVTYRVTSAGSAVMETIMPGTGHEMVTLYHLDSGKLVLTHYCVVGNQPKMVLTKKSSPDELVFDFAGGANVKPKKDAHMHALRLHFDSPNRLTAEWDYFKDGKKASTEKFSLQRKA